MKESEQQNAFKKLVPNHQLTAKDKKAVLKTIETVKLIMEAIDLITVKHVKTRVKLVSNFSNPKYPGEPYKEENPEEK